jgi:hypothetical protein
VGRGEGEFERKSKCVFFLVLSVELGKVEVVRIRIVSSFSPGFFLGT